MVTSFVNTSTTRPLASLKHDTITDLLTFLWNAKRLGTVTIATMKKSEEYKSCCDHFSCWKLLLDETLKDVIVALNSNEPQEYTVQGGEIGYKDQDSISFKVSYGYHTLFAYFKEYDAGKVSKSSLLQRMALTIRCGTYSYAEVPKEYVYILGVTGTLSDLADTQTKLLADEYGITKSTYIPSVYGDNQLFFQKEHPRGVLIEQEAGYFTAIKKEIDECQNRSVLIFFASKALLEVFQNSKEMVQYKGFSKTMTETTTQTEKTGLIKSAATKGNIVLLTREFGRGTDFICYDKELDKAGGVHVIQTFVSDLKSEETQIMGRTARQGKRGSYMMILKEKELEPYGLNEKEIRDMRDTGKLYSTLTKHRNAFFNRIFPESIKGVHGIKEEHKQALGFLEELSRATDLKVSPDSKDIAQGKIREFLLEQNKGFDMTSTSSKTICLMDATGSMAGLLQKSKNTVATMFQRAKVILQKEGLSDGFELQFACFRNYDCRVGDLLVASEWESNADNLRHFMHCIEAGGGTHWEEAVEVALFHANQESEKQEISQVILIGDAAPNTKSQVTQGRSRFGESYWANTRFNQPTYYEEEVKIFSEKNIPVHCYYVSEAAESSFRGIAEATKGTCDYLDIDSDAGAEKLTHAVTELILNQIGGSACVDKYRQTFVKGYV